METVRVDDLLAHFDDLDHAEKHGQRRRFHDSCRQIHRSRQKPTQRLRQNHFDERLPATQPKHIRGLILGFRNRLKRATHQIAQFRAAPQYEHEHACAGRIQIPIPRTGETVERDEQQRQLRHDANEIQINPGQHANDGILHRHQPADSQSHRNGKTHRNTGDPHRNPKALQQAREHARLEQNLSAAHSRTSVPAKCRTMRSAAESPSMRRPASATTRTCCSTCRSDPWPCTSRRQARWPTRRMIP